MEPLGQGLESGADAVGGARARGARVVRVQVLVHVEDEVVGAAVEVGDAGEDGRGASRYEGRGAGVTIT